MIKSAKCGLVTYKITGGYYVSPIWGTSKCRKGFVSGAPVKVYTKEEIEKLSEDEIYEIIKSDLYENAHTTQEKLHKKYKGKNLAEGLENLIFKCPSCGDVDKLKSTGNVVTCEKCNNSFSINEYGELANISYKNIFELYNWQEKEICKDIKKNIAYTSDGVLNSINRDHSKLQIASGDIEMTPKFLRCDNVVFNMEDITDMAICGKYGLVFSVDGEYYELLPNRNLSVYKFLLYYKHIKRNVKDK
jgi:ribosomal protein L37AE/L43A